MDYYADRSLETDVHELRRVRIVGTGAETPALLDEVLRRVDAWPRPPRLGPHTVPCTWAGSRLAIVDGSTGADAGQGTRGPAGPPCEVVVVDAKLGGSDLAGRTAATRFGGRVPRIVFVDGMESPAADFQQVMIALKDASRREYLASLKGPAQRRVWARAVCALQVPLDLGPNLWAAADLLEMRARVSRRPSPSSPFESGSTWSPIPFSAVRAAELIRADLLESIVEYSPDHLETYFESDTLPVGELRALIASATAAGQMVPVVFGSSALGAGIGWFLDAIVDFFPTDEATKAKRTSTPAPASEDGNVQAAARIVWLDPPELADRERDDDDDAVAGWIEQQIEDQGVIDPVAGHQVALAIRLGGREVWPSFQFRDLTTLELHPEIQVVDPLLHDGDDPLGAVSWWLTPNAWLGVAPRALLAQDKLDEIAFVARQLRNDSW